LATDLKDSLRFKKKYIKFRTRICANLLNLWPKNKGSPQNE
jgi:hypothetical protein